MSSTLLEISIHNFQLPENSASQPKLTENKNNSANVATQEPFASTLKYLDMISPEEFSERKKTEHSLKTESLPPLNLNSEVPDLCEIDLTKSRAQKNISPTDESEWDFCGKDVEDWVVVTP